jgi:hypothetical protein
VGVPTWRPHRHLGSASPPYGDGGSQEAGRDIGSLAGASGTSTLTLMHSSPMRLRVAGGNVHSGNGDNRKTRKRKPEIEWSFRERLGPGEYHAISRHASFYRDRQFQRWVCAVQFDVLDAAGIEVIGRCTWYMNLGSKEKPRCGRRSIYWQAWVKANGGQPKRSDRVSPSVFEGRAAIVRVEDTTKTFRQEVVDSESAYSVVREVIAWETGSTNHSNHTSRKAPNK